MRLRYSITRALSAAKVQAYAKLCIDSGARSFEAAFALVKRPEVGAATYRHSLPAPVLHPIARLFEARRRAARLESRARRAVETICDRGSK